MSQLVYVFAENLVEANNWAALNQLGPDEWRFVKGYKTLRAVYNAKYVILHGFHRHPDCQLLLATIRLRQFKQAGINEYKM